MAKKVRESVLQKHRILFGFLIVLIIIISGVLGIKLSHANKIANQQKLLQPFYTPSHDLDAHAVGDILKSEPLAFSVPGGKGYRILYVSQLSDEEKVAVSGMIFVPTKQTPHNIVAWAHGTIGMGTDCAPSRSTTSLQFLNWIPSMMDRGWTVVATDYYGLGTPGTERYLIGSDQGRDVLNSVLAAKNFDSEATQNYTIFGHSQGGQATLFAANLSSTYLPTFHLYGVATGAPAAELSSLMNQQFDQPVTWLIGPELAVAWPTIYPDINLKTSLTPEGYKTYQKVANTCIMDAVFGAIIRAKLKQQFYSTNPTTIASWRAALVQQSAKPVASDIPVMIAQSLSDTVVLPNTTAQYIQDSCAASSQISTLWLNDVNHNDTPKVAAPQVISWFEELFNGNPVPNNCSQPLPIQPYSTE